MTFRRKNASGRIELSYPHQEESIARPFELAVEESAKASSRQVDFVAGGLMYTLFSEQGAFEGGGAGLMIQHGDQLDILVCTAKTLRDDLIMISHDVPRAELRTIGQIKR